MSIAYSVRVGPYIVCRNETTEEPVIVWGCRNEDCRQFGRTTPTKPSEFCPACGKPIQSVASHKKTQKVRTWELHEELQSTLTLSQAVNVENCDCWIANRYNGLSFGWWFGSQFDLTYDPHTCRPMEIQWTPTQFTVGGDLQGRTPQYMPLPEAAIEMFKDIYSQELKQLVAAYGEGKVEVRWGILAWAD